MKPTALFATTLMATLTAVVSLIANAQSAPAIPGYALGQKTLAKAPYTLADLESLKKTLLFSDSDPSAIHFFQST